MITELDFVDFYLPGQAEYHLNFVTFDHLSLQKHTHKNFCEFYLVTGGVIRQFGSSGEAVLRRGTAVLVPEHAVHGFEVLEAYGDVAIVNLAFPVRLLRSIPTVNTHDWQDGSIKIIDLLEDDFDCLLRDMTALSQDNSDWEFKLGHILYNLIYFSRYRGWAADRSIPPYLAAAYQKMREIENLHGGLTRFFQLCGCSPDHVCRLCKKYYHATPTVLINRLRMSWTAEKLLLSDDKIEELAFRAGYCSLGHFYDQFDKVYGETPRRYRQRHRVW